MTKAAQAKRIAQRKLETAITSFMERKAPYPQVGEGGGFFLEAIVAVAAVTAAVVATACGASFCLAVRSKEYVDRNAVA